MRGADVLAVIINEHFPSLSVPTRRFRIRGPVSLGHGLKETLHEMCEQTRRDVELRGAEIRPWL